MARILIVEDDPDIVESIERYLRHEGFATERARDGRRALELWRAAAPDLIVLDIGLPELDGLEVLKRIRRESDVPVVILSARAEELDELLGLGLGADGYLAKPASARKLVAHVKAVLRRADPSPRRPPPVRVGPLEVDEYAMTASVGGAELALTPTEFRLLQHLARTPGRACGRSELYDAAMPESDAFERAVTVHITNLRQKLAAEDADDLLETVRGVGYRLADRPALRPVAEPDA